jgi:hypothetical protein
MGMNEELKKKIAAEKKKAQAMMLDGEIDEKTKKAMERKATVCVCMYMCVCVQRGDAVQCRSITLPQIARAQF